MKPVIAVLCLLALITVASAPFFARAEQQQCDPENPDGCGAGTATITPGGNSGQPGDGEYDFNGDIPEGEDVPFPDEGDEIDVSDPSTWPKADGPDIDLSGDVEEVDLSNYNFTDDQNQDVGAVDTPKDEEDPNKKLDEDEKEMKAFALIIARLEQIANEWTCAVSGSALYEIDGDSEVFDLVAQSVSQSLEGMNQEYGAQLIQQWSEGRERDNYTCTGIKRFDETLFDHPIALLMESKELLSQWLKKREVESSELIDATTPVFRSMFVRWSIMRLMVTAKDVSEGVSYPDKLGEALLPFVTDDDNPSDTCAAAAGLYTAFLRGDSNPSPAFIEKIENLVDVCYTAGKSSDKPVEYANHLNSCNREKQAAELYALAVERGELCHPLQRPESLHRKDLTARAVWPPNKFPELANLQEIGKALVPHLENLPFQDSPNMDSFLISGKWETVPIYNDGGFVEQQCTTLGDELCGKLKNLVEVVKDTNDGYIFGCNGTINIDVWKLTAPSTSPSDTGAANLVLQVLMPLKEGNGNTMTLRVGEEVALLEENELLIVDDTFENSFELTTSLPDGDAAAEPFYILHMQICHPDMDEKALTVPSKKCATRAAE